MRAPLLLLITLLLLISGCAMLGSWKAISPPGGCDQCHTKRISNDWKVAYRSVELSDEHGENPWQKPTSVLPEPTSPLEQKKITEQRCFRCHKGPDKAHVEYKGRYHH